MKIFKMFLTIPFVLLGLINASAAIIVDSNIMKNANVTVNGSLLDNPSIDVCLGPQLIPLGDSITAGTMFSVTAYGYRSYLQDELGILSYIFIGQFTNGSGTVYQTRHSGVIAETNTQIKARLNANLALFAKEKCNLHNVILIHAGTNDLAGSIPKTDTELNASISILSSMITTIHNFDPNIDVYVAQLIPSLGEPRDTNITGYNAKIQPMITGLGYQNVYSVNMNAAFRNDYFGLCGGNWQLNCMQDNLHPKPAGYRTMAKMWARCMSSPTAVGCNGN